LKTILHLSTEHHTPKYHNLELYIQDTPCLLLINLRILCKYRLVITFKVHTVLLPTSSFNLLKPTGHVMHQQFDIQQLYALPTLYLCVLYLSENKL